MNMVSKHRKARWERSQRAKKGTPFRRVLTYVQRFTKGDKSIEVTYSKHPTNGNTQVVAVEAVKEEA
jgi:hypothetical protein